MFENLLSSPVTLALIAANLAASFLGFSNQKFLDDNSLWIEAIYRRGEWHRLLTSGFLHGGGFHIALNLMSLAFIGPSLEDYFGPGRFAILYFGALLGGSAFDVFDKRHQRDYRAIGASGAVSGLALSVGILAPFALFIFIVVPMWAVVYGVLFIVMSYMLMRREDAIIAHGGHLGGALAGIALTLLLAPSSGPAFVQQIVEKFG
jgi:membrane associated rhomboid family serine protease